MHMWLLRQNLCITNTSSFCCMNPMCVYSSICVCVNVYICIQTLNMQTCTYVTAKCISISSIYMIHIYVHIFIYKYKHIYIYICVCVYIYAYIHIHTYTCRYTNICMYICRHACTCIHRSFGTSWTDPAYLTCCGALRGRHAADGNGPTRSFIGRTFSVLHLQERAFVCVCLYVCMCAYIYIYIYIYICK